MPRFRKKPVEVDAIQWTGDNWPDIAQFVGEDEDSVEVDDGSAGGGAGGDGLIIRTLEGDMRADPGDWVIRGTQQELYPCKPAIFADIYEPVEAQEGEG